MKNQEVAHRWAQRRGDSGKGSNFYYEGDTLYSYGSHFIVARHMTAPNGTHFVLMNPEPYSISTTRHQHHAKCAIPGNTPIIWANPGNITPQTWLKELCSRYDATLAKFRRATRNKAMIATALDDLRLQMDFVAWEYDIDFDIPAAEDYSELLAEFEAQERERQDKRDAKHAADIEAWKSGEKEDAPRTRKVYLRVDGDSIETSHGALVPLSVAPGLWRAILRAKREGRSYKPAPSEAPVGYYTLGEIYADGSIRVGCHHIEFDELERIAGVLNLGVHAETD